MNSSPVFPTLNFCLVTIMAMWLNLGLAPHVQAGVNQWTPIGPEGGFTTTIKFDPQQPQTVYALADYRIFKSTSEGAEWSRLAGGLPQSHVAALVIDPSHSQTLYASVGGFVKDIYKSTNGGESWSLFPVVFPGRVTTGLTAVDPSNSQVLYANGSDPPRPHQTVIFSNVFKSTDGGASWTPLDVSAGTVVVDPRDSQVVYRWGRDSATGINGVSKSVNGGVSWQTIFTEHNVLSFTLAPSNSQVLYVGGSTYNSGAPEPWVWKSSNGGETWLPVLNGAFVLSLAVDPSDTQLVYALTDSRLYKTTDGGETWTEVLGYKIGHSDKRDIAIQPAPHNLLLVASATEGVYRSTDRGETWTESNSGLVATSIRSVAVSLSNPQILYATTGRSSPYDDLLFRKTTTGHKWEFIGEIIGVGTPFIVPRGGEQSILLVDPTNPEVLYVEGLKSTNGGKSWETIGGRPFWSSSAIVMDPTNPAVLYAANTELPEGYDNTKQMWVPRAAITKSEDGGQTWAVVFTDQPVCGLALAPSDPQILYASGRSTFTSGYNLIKSRDAGRTWNLVAQDQPLGCQLTVDPLHPEIVYVAAQNNVAGENSAKSTDGGITWAKLSTLSLTPFVIDPLNTQIIYSGAPGGVLMSNDGGNTWSTLNEGLPSHFYVQTLVIDPTNPRVLYAGTASEGVFHLEQQAPISVTRIDPTSGTTIGGTVVTISGNNFLPGATVTIGGSPATNITVVNATTITASTPPGSAGTANVVVINPGCTGEPTCSATLADAFTYVVPPPPPVQLSVTTLDFGTVKVGKRRERRFTVKNLGATKQTVTLSTTAPFSLRSAATVAIKPGKSVKVKVQFAPTSPGPFTGTVVVADPITEGNLSVAVNGVGVAR